MSQPAEEQDWQAADQLAGMQDVPPQPPQPVDLTPAPAYQGGAPAGALTATPRQATAETLNSLETTKDLTGKQGQTDADTSEKLASALDQDVEEKRKRAQDFDTAFDKAMSTQESDHQRVVAANQEYGKAAGSLKSPTEEYWADKSTGSRVLSAFAAFASGLGAGLQGHPGNPYLDYLNREIEQNYEAHKQNIADLYQKQVAAGKIADDSQTRVKFLLDGKLHSFDLSAEYLKSKLEAIKNRGLGQNYRTLADISIQGLTQQQIAMRRAQAQQEAAAAAAAAAAYRAKSNEAGAKYDEAYKASIAAGYSPEQARQDAAILVEKRGYDRSIVAPIAEANGGKYNPKSGQYEYQPVTPKAGGDDLIPATDPVTGKPLKQDERDKLAALKVTLPDGSTRLANNAEDQKKVQQEIVAHQTVTTFADKLRGPNGWIAKMNDGTLTSADIGEWEGARKASIEAYKALSGAEGNTGVGTARMLGEDEFPNPPSLAGNVAGKVAGVATLGQLHTAPGRVGQYTGQLKNMDALAERTGESIQRRLRPGGTKPTEAAPKESPKTGKDFFAQFGGK